MQPQVIFKLNLGRFLFLFLSVRIFRRFTYILILSTYVLQINVNHFGVKYTAHSKRLQLMATVGTSWKKNCLESVGAFTAV